MWLSGLVSAEGRLRNPLPLSRVLYVYRLSALSLRVTVGRGKRNTFRLTSPEHQKDKPLPRVGGARA